MRKLFWFFCAPALLGLAPLHAAPPAPTLSVSNEVKTLTWPRPLWPGLETNRLWAGPEVTNLAVVPGDLIQATGLGYSWATSNTLPREFFALEVGQMSSNALLTATVLNRLAFGPTPDELERVKAIGPGAYIDEQLAPEGLPEPALEYVTTLTNGAAGAMTPNQWLRTSVTGQVTSSTLYITLSGAGEAIVDDLQLARIITSYETNLVDTNTVITTNVTVGTNVLVNADFEAPLSNGWTVSANLAGSSITNGLAASGTSSLHLIATSGGSNQSSSIWQAITPALSNGQRCVLSFAYLARSNSSLSRINIRLSGGGVIGSDNEPPPLPTWIYVTGTGTATANQNLYMYLSAGGNVNIDDVKLVAGTQAEAGANLLQNGDFESPLTTGWQLSANYSNSYISSVLSHSGQGSLRIVGGVAGSGSGNAVFQSNIAGLTNGQTYTVSFWCTLPNRGNTLTVRLSGSLLVATAPQASVAGLQYRFDNPAPPNPETGAVDRNQLIGGTLADLRAWRILRGVGSGRQLLEVLAEFLENHFVTEHSKSVDFFDRYYNDGTLMDILAAGIEYAENRAWRNKLQDPNCTFYDLLKISAESPAMIIYLDTVDSRGDGTKIANENYARELFELFCMGVDNGYDQLDITAMSRAWTGWALDIVDPVNVGNLLAPQSRTYGFYPTSSWQTTSNLVGVWSSVFKSANHGTNRAPILSAWAPNATRTNLIAVGPKIVPARFGSPWAGTPYQLNIPGRAGTNGVEDGYDVIRHLANLPFTMEYISIKLCRLFVHDDFPNPTTLTDHPEYAFYDYTSPTVTPEAQLVRQCMLAWDTPGPDGRKGNMRSVLRTIFNSELFRGYGGSLQKVKTPLEYTVSAIRALRSAGLNGSFTANTDGYSITGRSRVPSSAPILRMGDMRLFDRDSPDGYPEAGPPWISAGTLAERIRFVQTTLMAVGDTNKADAISGGNNNVADPVGLLKKKLTSGSWNDPGAVADYFLGILYSAEGKANLDLYRLSAIQFLNTDNDGVTFSPFQALGNTSAAYDTRVRGMVALLMTLPRFQEQ